MAISISPSLRSRVPAFIIPRQADAISSSDLRYEGAYTAGHVRR